jgi:hypothetical protein
MSERQPADRRVAHGLETLAAAIELSLQDFVNE